MMKLSIIRLVKNLGDNKKLLLISIFTSKSIFTEGDYSKSFYIKPSSVNPDALIKIYESLESDKDKKDFINQMSLLRSNDRISEMLVGSEDRDLVDYLSDDYKLKELHSLLKTIADRFSLEVEGVFTNTDENHRVHYITEMRDNFQVTDQPIYGALYNIVELDNKGKLQAGDTIRTINGLECIEKIEDRIFITCDGNKYNMNEVERVVHKKSCQNIC